MGASYKKKNKGTFSLIGFYLLILCIRPRRIQKWLSPSCPRNGNPLFWVFFWKKWPISTTFTHSFFDKSAIFSPVELIKKWISLFWDSPTSTVGFVILCPKHNLKKGKTQSTDNFSFFAVTFVQEVYFLWCWICVPNLESLYTVQ